MISYKCHESKVKVATTFNVLHVYFPAKMYTSGFIKFHDFLNAEKVAGSSACSYKRHRYKVYMADIRGRAFDLQLFGQDNVQVWHFALPLFTHGWC